MNYTYSQRQIHGQNCKGQRYNEKMFCEINLIYNLFFQSDAQHVKIQEQLGIILKILDTLKKLKLNFQ